MRRRRPEAGASAVEAALVTPLFLLLLFGVVEFGLFFKNFLSASDAAKAGVRVASASARTGGYAQRVADTVATSGVALDKGSVEQLWVYKANPTNDFPVGTSSFAGGCSVCVTFRWNGTAFVPLSDTWPAASQNACASGPPDRVGVYVQARHTAVTRLVFSSFTIRQSDVLRFEPMPASGGCRP